MYRRVSGLEREDRGTTEDNAEVVDETQSSSLSIFSVIKSSINAILPVESLPFYFRHPVFLASFALSLLHLTVLSFSGQMITYLISVGYTSWHVGVARVGSSLFEISATWTAPFLMRKIGVVRAGIWSLTWQMACLGGALAWHYSYLDGAGKSSVLAATGLVVGVALSRIGLWGYDLSAQNIIQDVRIVLFALFVLEASLAISANTWGYRKSRTITEGHSLRSRLRSRTSLRCSPTPRPSSSRARTSSSIPWSFLWQLYTVREVSMPISCGSVGVISFMRHRVCDQKLEDMACFLVQGTVFLKFARSDLQRFLSSHLVFLQCLPSSAMC